MFNVRLAGGHLYGKQLFTWLSLMVSLMASFVLSFFPLDVLDEIWDLIESVSEGFLTYSCMFYTKNRDSFEYCLRQNDVVPLEEKQKIKEELSKVKHRKLILKTDQPTRYWLLD